MPSRDHKFVGYAFAAVVTTHGVFIGLVKLTGVAIEAAGIKACRHAALVD